MAPSVVVITGCSSGIGLETAVLLANDKEKRFRVFATMRNLKKQAPLESAAGSALDQTLFICELDVTKEDSVNKFMDRINKEEGGVDVLINNAGIGQSGTIEKVTDSQIRTVYETNVFGLIRMTQAVLPGMKAKRSGRIINVSSLAGLVGVPFSDIYVSSKFAVAGFSESLAPVLKRFNISVSLIEPGPVKTSFLANISANNTGKTRLDIDDPVDPDVDELTSELLKATQLAGKNRSVESIQTGAEIAEIIRGAILSEKPQLHYVTKESFEKILSAIKFVDVTGDSLVDKLAALNNIAEK